MDKMFDVDSVRELLGMPKSAAEIPTIVPEPKRNPQGGLITCFWLSARIRTQGTARLLF